jgi:NAD(P)-dependent dehydrogenase (short-subunit alcohol dehydrogenase family)
MSSKSSNKVALITGAAGAFGSALSLQCARAGWETILVGKNKKKLEVLYDEIVKRNGPKPLIFPTDLTRLGPADCEEMVEAIQATTGRLDALVHCAVRFPGLRPIDQILPQDWLCEVQVNLNVPWLLSIYCLPLLRLSPQASLYFLLEDMTKMSSAYWGSYGVSKHGLQSLAVQFQAELSNTAIQVLAINPGPMKSSLRSRVYHSEDPKKFDLPEVSAEKTLRLLERKHLADSGMIDLEELDPISS